MESEKNAIRPVSEGPGHHYYTVRPSDFNLARGLSSTFGKAEVEMAAANLIRFCQRRGGWYPFTIEELIAYYKEEGENPKFIFFGLLGAWEDDGMLSQMANPWRVPARHYLVLDARGMYLVTESFIRQCASGKPTALIAK